MPYHAIAILSGDRQKTLPNKTDSDILSKIVLPFVANGIVTARWGKETISYQVLELRIYETSEAWDKRNGKLESFIKNKRNQYSKFEKRAKGLLATSKFRAFIVMPIQGDKYGVQDQQRIHEEYDKRFEAIESVVSKAGGVAIRIDKEHPLEDLVGRIKEEIRNAKFLIADLTDERPSCYYEAGFAEALEKPIIYIASKQSIVSTKADTKIHFDIHQNVHFFSNHKELKEKLKAAIKKNRKRLIEE